MRSAASTVERARWSLCSPGAGGGRALGRRSGRLIDRGIAVPTSRPCSPLAGALFKAKLLVLRRVDCL
jgi:hypothetical protein